MKQPPLKNTSKNRILNNVIQLCNKYFNVYKKSYNSKNVKNEEKKSVTINSLK